jgi:predicted RNase H-like HicB family nuclease
VPESQVESPSSSILGTQKQPKEENVKSYVFRVILEPDEQAWRAYIPDLEEKGGATWGKTKEEALGNIREVAQLVIESMLEDGDPLPAGVTEMNEPVVAVTV